MIHDSQIAGYGDDMVKRICSRCQTHNAASSGQFDLLVRSVRLGEDEEYECQVLPGPMAPIKVPLRASVHIEIQGERETEGGSEEERARIKTSKGSKNIRQWGAIPDQNESRECPT